MNKAFFKIQILFIFATVLLLSSCGFHLKGDMSIKSNYESVVIHNDNAAQISALLSQSLQEKSVRVSRQIKTNSLQIFLRHENIKQRSVAIRNQENKAYEMELSIYLTIKDAQGNSLRDEQRLSSSRVYPYNSSQVLSSVNEENILHKELKGLIVNKILYILDSL